MASNSVNIITSQSETVTIEQPSNIVTITDNVESSQVSVEVTSPTNISLQEESISVVEVSSIGPQGPQGPQGDQGPIGSGSDQGTSPTNVYLTPTKIICQDLVNINLTGSAYTSSGMFELNWTGSQGEMTMHLPDATDVNNTYRSIRFITNGTYETNTRTYLTPSGSQTLDGSTGFYEINKAYEGIMIWSDGIEWFRIQTKA